MPTASKRQSAITNLVTQLAAIAGPDSTYYVSLAGVGQVSTVMRSKSALLAMPYRSWVWIHEGPEEFESISVTDLTYQARLRLYLEVLVSDNTADDMRLELNKVLHDIHLAIGGDPTLGGVVADAHVASIEEPAYALDEGQGAVTMHVDVLYDFEAGSTI